MVDSLMTMIRGKFYGDLPAEKWFKDKAFVLKNVVLWPATWLNERGLTISPARYEQIVVEKINDSVRNARGPITNPSGWLMKCLQDHFRHHEDTLHDEAKAFSATVDAALATAAAVIQPKRRVQAKKTGGPQREFLLS